MGVLRFGSSQGSAHLSESDVPFVLVSGSGSGLGH